MNLWFGLLIVAGLMFIYYLLKKDQVKMVLKMAVQEGFRNADAHKTKIKTLLNKSKQLNSSEQNKEEVSTNDEQQIVKENNKIGD